MTDILEEILNDEKDAKRFGFVSGTLKNDYLFKLRHG
jgi:hypothetical protein